MSSQKSSLLPAIIDVEASGFGKGSYPIEVGVIRSDGKSYCSLIKPAASWNNWDPQAEAVHGVSRSKLLECGQDLKTVAERLNRQLAGTTVYSDAWGQDYAWLSLLFEEAGLTMEFRIESLSALLSEAQKVVWHATRARVEQMLGLQRHRASSDARILQMTYHWSISSCSTSAHHAAIGAV